MLQLHVAWHAMNLTFMWRLALSWCAACCWIWQAALLRMLPPALTSLGPLSLWFASWYIAKYEAKYADLSASTSLDEVMTADALLSLLAASPLTNRFCVALGGNASLFMPHMCTQQVPNMQILTRAPFPAAGEGHPT